MELARPVERGDARCPYCHDGLEAEATVACDGCGAAHHGACWEELGRCATCRGGTAAPDPDIVPGGLRVEERAGALTIVRPPGAVAWRDLAFGLLCLGVGLLFAAVGLSMLVLERALLGLAPLALGGAFSLLVAWALLSVVAGQDVLTVTADAVTLRHHFRGLSLAPSRRARAADVTEVRAEGRRLRVVQGDAAFTWEDFDPVEAAWIAARVRRRLGRA